MDQPGLSDIILRNIHNISWNKTAGEIILFWGYFRGNIVLLFRGEDVISVGKHIEKSSKVGALKHEISTIKS